LHGAARIGPWIAAGPMDTGVRIGSHDPVLRIGNAAGEAHPILGEGLSMALQSAFILCTNLLGAPSPAQLCDRASRREIGARYAAQWRRAFAPRVLLAATFAHAAMGTASGPALSALVRAWPGLLTHGARWGGKVHNAAAR
jgi:flavin-dependent dehydrogenase